MERNRGSQVLAIVALLLAVGGLSLGFAAFSETLTIKSSAEVKPANDFNVDFLSQTNAETTTVAGVVSGETGATAGEATINNATNAPTIGGLKANFTKPGQTVTYTFDVANTGKLQAYLKKVTFAAPAKTCTANATNTSGTGTATDSLVQAACEDISIKISVDGTEYATTTAVSDGTGLAPVDGNGAVVAAGKKEVVVTITYAADGDRADGDFTVAFGDISLDYNSVKGA